MSSQFFWLTLELTKEQSGTARYARVLNISFARLRRRRILPSKRGNLAATVSGAVVD